MAFDSFFYWGWSSLLSLVWSLVGWGPIIRMFGMVVILDANSSLHAKVFWVSPSRWFLIMAFKFQRVGRALRASSFSWSGRQMLKGRIVWLGCLVVRGFSRLLILGWESLRPRNSLVPWSNLVWFEGNIPRHPFMAWFIVWNRLQIRDCINGWCSVVPCACVLCNCGLNR